MSMTRQAAVAMKQALGINWKTTLAGIGMILMAAAHSIQVLTGEREWSEVPVILGMFTTGIGLIFAKDGNPTPA